MSNKNEDSSHIAAAGQKLLTDKKDSEQISRRRCIQTFGAAACLAGSGLFGCESNLDDDAEFEPLFDGSSLAGWHTNKDLTRHGTGGNWKVADGVLFGQQDPPGSGNGGLLLSDRKFADFELLISMHPQWGTDSGIFVRCTEAGSGIQMYVDYYQNGNIGHLRGEMRENFPMKPFQLLGQFSNDGKLIGFDTQEDPRSAEWPEGVYEYTCSPEQFIEAWKIDDWNVCKIRCVGKFPQLSTWINDVKICHFNGERSALPGYDKEAVFEQLGRHGSIGLQVHGGDAWPAESWCRWKSIRVREL